MFSSLVAGCLAVAAAFALAFELVLASSADTRLHGGSTTSKAATRTSSRVVACRIEHLSVPRGREPCRETRFPRDHDLARASEIVSLGLWVRFRNCELDQEVKSIVRSIYAGFRRSTKREGQADQLAGQRISCIQASWPFGQRLRRMLFSEPFDWRHPRLCVCECPVKPIAQKH